MTGYRAITHFKLKRGKEDEAMRFLEEDLVKASLRFGSHDSELLYSDISPNIVVGIGLYDNINSAMQLKNFIEKNKAQILELFDEMPKREILRIKSTSTNRSRNVA